MRTLVACNPNIPVETLKLLATDKEELVRRVGAFNPSTPVETLEVLATDKNNYAL